MSSLAIECRNLGKRYCIGAAEPYATLRDRLAELPSRITETIALTLRNRGISQAPHIWALRELDLEVDEGQVLGIVGRNGAGKSTLLKILCRITAPTTGEARVRGRVGSLLEVGTGFHPELTGRENVFVNGAVLGMRRWEIQKKFDEIVEFSGVEQFIDTPVKRYSSGMRLRLAFAVAAHLDAEILFVDEALSVGDASFQRKCLDSMQGLSRSGRTVVLVSHQLDVIAGLCDRVAWLEKGQMVAAGNADTIVRQYLGALDQDREQTSGRVEFPPPPPNAFDFRVYELSLKVDGRPTATVMSGDALTFSLTYEAARPVQDFETTIWIKDSYQRRLACLYNKMTGYDLEAPAGVHSVECRIPRFPLNAGAYSLHFSVSSGSLPLQSAPDILPFTVVAGNFFGAGRRVEGYGEVLIDHRWKLLEASAAAQMLSVESRE